MNPSKRAREARIMDWSLFLSAYAPMFAIAAVKWEGTALKLALAGCFLVAAAPMTAILFNGSNQEPGDFTIETISVSADLNAGFLATYLLPFLTVDTPSRTSLLAYALFVWIVGLIFTRGRVTNVNPLLYIFGYHIAEVVTDDGKRFNLITWRLPDAKEDIKATQLLGGYMLLHIVTL